MQENCKLIFQRLVRRLVPLRLVRLVRLVLALRLVRLVRLVRLLLELLLELQFFLHSQQKRLNLQERGKQKTFSLLWLFWLFDN
jgi:hypothetical protein